MGKSDISQGRRHQHRGKFTEDLLDNKRILNALHIQPGQTILDAGCGNGYMAKLFSKVVTSSGKVYALDPDKQFLKNLDIETRGTNIETIEGDITRPTQIRGTSLDLMYVSTVIHAFSQKEMKGFLAEAKRLLKPDALLAIVEIEKKETPFGPPLEQRYSPQDLKEKISMHPVETVKVAAYFYMQVFRNQIETS